ncbi:MAG: hypothetical protein MJE77_01050 [Proteobacteria bacterium]|nr:hypothetical protein [Pseudomonadota bacterium]
MSDATRPPKTDPVRVLILWNAREEPPVSPESSSTAARPGEQERDRTATERIELAAQTGQRPAAASKELAGVAEAGRGVEAVGSAAPVHGVPAPSASAARPGPGPGDPALAPPPEAAAEAPGRSGELGEPSQVRSSGHNAVVDDVEKALEQAGFAVASIDIEDDITRIVDAMIVERPALIFNLVDEFEGDNTRHAAVAAYLDLLAIPYTGSDPTCLAICQDRARTRVLLADGGISVPRFEVIRDINVIPDTGHFRFPVVVTQAFDDLYDEEGSERPIHDQNQLINRCAELFKEFELPYLVEEYIECRRLHAVVIGNRVVEVLPLVELGEDEQEDNSAAGEQPWVLAQLDYATADQVRQLARRAFRVMGCRDAAQIDFHLDYEGRPYITDVRATFELGSDSVFRSACEYTDRGFSGLIAEIARLVCQRALIAEPNPVAHPESVPVLSGPVGLPAPGVSLQISVSSPDSAQESDRAEPPEPVEPPKPVE